MKKNTTIGTGITSVAKPAPATSRKGGKFVKQSKATRIRNLIAKGLTATEIVADLAKKKITVRYSQVHRYFQNAEVVTA